MFRQVRDVAEMDRQRLPALTPNRNRGMWSLELWGLRHLTLALSPFEAERVVANSVRVVIHPIGPNPSESRLFVSLLLLSHKP